MHWNQSWLLFLLCLFCVQVVPNLCYLVDNNPYRHAEILDPKGKYQLEWLVDWKKERVVFNVTVQTKGYIGFGLSRKGKMAGADIVIGGVGSNGKPYFSDRHAIGNVYPVLDESQDWALHSAWETHTHTSIKFSRAFDTCDEHDIPINDDVVSIIWAFGENDNSNEYHFENRGNFTVYLRDPDLAPRAVQQSTTLSTRPKQFRDLNIWSITSKLQIPPKRTTYWCDFHKIDLPRKHHIVGYNFRGNQESQSNVHHLLLFRCTPPPNLNPASIYEPFIRQNRGGECYATYDPSGGQEGELPTQYCVDISYGHAIGGRADFYPDHVGVPIGESATEYYLLQVHYDNPSSRADIMSEIQIDVYYTDKLRKNDAGILSLGHHISGSPSLLIPPSSLNHRMYAHCSPTCTERNFPAEGIKIVAALLHSHNAGRQVRIQHFRNNRELPWIANDDNYNNTYQPTRFLRKEVTILPGDQVTMRCVYDTTNKNSTTVGGYSTEQEMCKTFMVYYNKIKNFPICRSEIISPEYMNRYLGITNVTWDQSKLEFVATSPSSRAGYAISEVSDTFVDWNIELRGELQKDHIIYPHFAICPAIGNPNPGTQQPSFVHYPVQATPFQPPQRCSLSR